MSMVMSPVLVPQQNGPPIIFNVPMMCPTPNMLNSSTAGSTTSVTSALSPNATPAMSSQQSSSTLTLTPPPLVQKSSFLAATTSLNLSQAQTTLSTPTSGRETRRELNPRPVPSLQPIPIQAAVDLTRNQMSPAKIIEKIEVKIENAMTTATSVLLS